MFVLILFLSINDKFMEYRQPIFHSLESCEVALKQAKTDPDFVSGVCKEM